jgi:hypothetical protein
MIGLRTLMLGVQMAMSTPYLASRSANARSTAAASRMSSAGAQ